MYNSQIRKVDLAKIDFSSIPYGTYDLDETPREKIKNRTF